MSDVSDLTPLSIIIIILKIGVEEGVIVTTAGLVEMITIWVITKKLLLSMILIASRM